MMSACANQAIEKPCAVTQMKLAIPFSRRDGDRPRDINHRIKGKFLFHKVLFAAVAPSCKKFCSRDDGISQLTFAKSCSPFLWQYRFRSGLQKKDVSTSREISVILPSLHILAKVQSKGTVIIRLGIVCPNAKC
jgi:hypothetical protein